MASNANGAEKPHPVFKVGPIATGRGENVSACVWKNERQTEDGRTYYVFSMELASSYLNGKDGQWKTARGFRVNQLAALDWIVRKCTEFIFSAKNPQKGESEPADGEDDRDVPY